MAQCSHSFLSSLKVSISEDRNRLGMIIVRTCNLQDSELNEVRRWRVEGLVYLCHVHTRFVRPSCTASWAIRRFTRRAVSVPKCTVKFLKHSSSGNKHVSMPHEPAQLSGCG